jgi:hypothetical protein
MTCRSKKMTTALKPGEAHSRRARRALFPLAAIAAAGSSSCGRSQTSEHAPDTIVGAYQLVSLEEPGPDGIVHRAEATGSLVLTREGRMSVQVMYRDTQTATGPVQYAQGGYEASFGRYEVAEPGQSFTYHVEGALVRKLVGQDQKRLYALKDGRLVITPPAANEHWRVTWERYRGTP